MKNTSTKQSFPQATGKVPVLVFMLLKVLRLSSQRRCVIDGSEEQATTQTGGMSAQTADRHVHTCPEAEAEQSGAYQQRRTPSDYCHVYGR